ncbi:MAG: maleylpyruvate isomerase family mycothiol-dependent enzyme [Actinomycetota bacterium]|nr:maleylpyruvate isomerase family mycothiol-dependent enzyme [Actinomycetota bacterium]
MAKLDEVYAVVHKEIANVVSSLPAKDLKRKVPATPDWSIRDVVAHLTGTAERMAAGDFPSHFFFPTGAEHAVEAHNEWNERQVSERRKRSVQELFDEWETTTPKIAPMLRGDVPWGQEAVPFGGHVMVTDLAAHQQDIYGALGQETDRDAIPIRIGFATYIGGVDLRIRASESPALRFVTEQKEVVAGFGEPAATVTASRFEFFRALSGRRNLDQVRAYEWDGDADPFLKFFYPYGPRTDALVE